MLGRYDTHSFVYGTNIFYISNMAKFHDFILSRADKIVSGNSYKTLKFMIVFSQMSPKMWNAWKFWSMNKRAGIQYITVIINYIEIHTESSCFMNNLYTISILVFLKLHAQLLFTKLPGSDLQNSHSKTTLMRA